MPSRIGAALYVHVGAVSGLGWEGHRAAPCGGRVQGGAGARVGVAPGMGFIRRREALVYNTPGDHVTRDIREGIAKLGDLRFCVLDSAGLETAATSGSILSRTADMTGNVLARSQYAIFLIDVRDGLQPLDLEVGQWLRKHASGIHTIVVMNKSESLDEHGVLTAAAGEAHKLGFGDPVAISAETGLGMAELYETLRPLFEEYMFQLPNSKYSL
ncbi:hypothetical protein GUJ93_ZPchr0001g32934 [Zizania palustris]|uniref:G domain-containing protein n=1 Tax=Zizania palustris TaxID=103762 RepID=A0A8J5VSV2_ZIZPA|nr:hypothetical protein GUJ93_ZPchr0001g32934 [Zizania palustris]